MSEQLLPCPFCGNQPWLDDDMETGGQVECANSKCLVCPSIFYDNEENSSGIDLATEAWNTRYIAKPSETDIIEAIRSISKPLGYAIGVHGSLRRDIDLIAVAWIAGAISPTDLVLAIADGIGYRRDHPVMAKSGILKALFIAHNATRLDAPEAKGHWSPMAIDLSVVDARQTGPSEGIIK